MTLKIKLTKVNGATALVLPEELLEDLHARQGDDVLVTQTQEGLTLRPVSAEASDHGAVAQRVMREDRDILRRLAE